MKFTVLTLFPQLIESYLTLGLVGQAREQGLMEIKALNPREFATNAHHSVDDRAFGGGDGMLMMVEPLASALQTIPREGRRVTVLSPQGRTWTQKDAREWAEGSEHHVLVCGRYAGIDHRFNVLYADDEISLGDFILNGGEVAALAVIESVVRLIPGALGNRRSALNDSFSEEWLECPQFTRPREMNGIPVPAALLSGNHAKIAEFESAVAKIRTVLLRPDLVSDGYDVTKDLAVVEGLSEQELLALGITRDDLQEVRNGAR